MSARSPIRSAASAMRVVGRNLWAALVLVGTLVPALAIGLNWSGATRAGAIASISTGLVLTLGLETLAWFKLFALPTGVTVSGLALLLSILVFFAVSWLTRARAESEIDADVRLVMEV